jgi:hypothetical protein
MAKGVVKYGIYTIRKNRLIGIAVWIGLYAVSRKQRRRDYNVPEIGRP